MGTEELIPNSLKDERLAAEIDTPEELAVRAGIDPALYEHIEAGRVLPSASELEALTTALGGISILRLYGSSVARGIPGQMFKIWPDHSFADHAASAHYRVLADNCHMLIARNEVTWFERQPGPNHRVDVYVNLSCGTQLFPHLLLDTVAVLERLGVSFVAAAGTAACCGKPFVNDGKAETAERFSQSRIDRSRGWGARTHVNWCQRCQFTSSAAAARRLHADGVEHPVREVQVPSFLEERLLELGDRVPWMKEVRRRVLVDDHPAYSSVHRDGQEAEVRLLDLIPGVEVVDFYDGSSDDSPCAKGPTTTSGQDSAESIREHRTRLADYAQSVGADTVSCRGQACHGLWSRYASDRLAVRHAVSILAEALDCAHPDRYQAAVRLGDPDEFLAQTRPVWQSWGLSEARARELAESISDPRYADAARCSCSGDDNCREDLISVDVLTGASQPLRAN